MLDPYKEFLETRIEDCPDPSANQIHEWLNDNHEDLIDVNEKTVLNFFCISAANTEDQNPLIIRDYEQVEDSPFCK